MSQSTDTTLLELAKQLDTHVQFVSATREMEQTVLDLSRQRDVPWKNVTLSQDGRIFRVKVFIRSEIFRIGLTRDFFKALRFADMATLCFWKYRRRNADSIGDGYFNFRLEDARRDFHEEAPAMMLLLQIEKHLTTLHLEWLDSSITKKPRQTRQDLIQQELREVQDKLDHILTTVKPFYSHLADLENTVRELANRLPPQVVDYFPPVPTSDKSAIGATGESKAETGDIFTPSGAIVETAGKVIRGVADSGPVLNEDFSKAVLKVFSPSPSTQPQLKSQ
jgi:hypothetical protein